AGFALDHCDRQLPQALVGYADDSGLRHFGMGAQQLAELFRHDFEPAARDRAVGASDEEDETVRVDSRDVVGFNPLGPDGIDLHDQPADLVSRKILARVRIDDTDAATWQHL